MPTPFMFVSGGSWSDAFESVRKIGDQPGLELYGCQRGNSAGNEKEDDTVSNLGRGDECLNLVCNVKDFTLMVGVEIDRVGMDGHAASRVSRKELRVSDLFQAFSNLVKSGCRQGTLRKEDPERHRHRPHLSRTRPRRSQDPRNRQRGRR